MFHQSIKKELAIACLLLTFIVTFAASAHRQDFRVTEALLKADDGRMSGPCPMKVVFNGNIAANGPGTVKYNFTRSDGATSPTREMEFKQAGRQAVSTDWTLGDARVMPHFEGWQAIRILSPNSYESEKASFTLDCGPPHGKPSTSVNQAKTAAEIYAQAWPNLAAPYRRRLENELASLKSFSQQLQPALSEAQQKLGLDPKSMNAEFRAIMDEQDMAKRAQRSTEFRSKYEPQIKKLDQSAGIDPATQRRQLITLLDLSNTRIREGGRMVLEIDGEPEPTPTPTPEPAPVAPELTVSVLSAPFTSAGTADNGGGLTAGTPTADAATGNLRVENITAAIGSAQKVAFIVQTLPVERGVRHVRVAANFDPLTHQFLASPLGYISLAALVNLRVMDGSRVVASSIGYSLGRLVTVTGYADTGGTTSLTMVCEFTRSDPDNAATYTLVAEIEGWSGSAGFPASATVDIRGTVRDFRVSLDRR